MRSLNLRVFWPAKIIFKKNQLCELFIFYSYDVERRPEGCLQKFFKGHLDHTLTFRTLHKVLKFKASSKSNTRAVPVHGGSVLPCTDRGEGAGCAVICFVSQPGLWKAPASCQFREGEDSVPPEPVSVGTRDPLPKGGTQPRSSPSPSRWFNCPS